MSQDITAVESLLIREVGALGYDMVMAQWVNEHNRLTLRVYIDFPEAEAYEPVQPDGTPGAARLIQVADCAKVNRALLDMEDLDALVPGPYDLEVSSPGIERPLRTRRDFERFAGRRVRIQTRDLVEGRRRFLGDLLGVEGEDIKILTTDDKRVFQLPLADILKAKLKPDQAELFAPKK